MAIAEATVEELVGMIERGELHLPEMQRRYVYPFGARPAQLFVPRVSLRDDPALAD